MERNSSVSFKRDSGLPRRLRAFWHGPRLRGRPPMILIEIVPHGNIPFRFPGNPARTMLYSTGHHHLHPALSKKEHYGPGCPTTPARSV